MMSRPRIDKKCLASATMLRPSGVSSASDERSAASASSSLATPSAGMKSVAMRLPRVIVPVLSRRTTSTSPAASTARPERAITLCRMRRSMPAIPMAGRRPPMVVGMRQTRSATRTGTAIVTPLYAAKGERVATTTIKRTVSPTRRISRAISFGVFCRFALSTIEIMWSRKVSPGFAVIITFILPERTRVPPVTALRSPFASLMTGADSPVTADSSTRATPSTISPSPGTGSPSSMRTMSSFLKERAGTLSVFPPSTILLAYASVCAFLSVSACALPLPSARASAKVAKSTVNQSQTLIWRLSRKGPP